MWVTIHANPGGQWINFGCNSPLNYSLRTVITGRGAFPYDDTTRKLHYLGLRNVAKKWTRPIRDWKAALNQFVVLYGARVPV